MPTGEDLAEVECTYDLGSRHCITSAMSCSTSRMAMPSLASELEQELGERLGLLLVLAGGRLVQEEHARGWIASARASSTSRPCPVGRACRRVSSRDRRSAPRRSSSRSATVRCRTLECIAALAPPAYAGWRRPGCFPARSAARTARAAGRCGPCRAGRACTAADRTEVLAVEADLSPSSGRRPADPVMMLNIVVLPAPLGPIRPVTSTGLRPRVRRWTARCDRRSGP